MGTLSSRTPLGLASGEHSQRQGTVTFGADDRTILRRTTGRFEIVADSRNAEYDEYDDSYEVEYDAHYAAGTPPRNRDEWDDEHAQMTAGQADPVAGLDEEWAAHARSMAERPMATGQRPQPSYRAEELISALPVHREAPAERGLRGLLRMRPGPAE